PSSGINYYRVRQVDANGQYSYSKVVQISFVDGVSFGIRNLGQQSFGFTGINGKAVMKVYDINGRLLLTKSVTNDDREFLLGFSSGSYAVTLEEGDNFYSGIFLLSR
ncbi:MAG: T9SS type A sorting domain-containing protein, partial [Saprospiraceae bacterium]|nr:T9SS type A sorting domain-containing protein [Saprospiraceae bacterium]